MTGDPDDDAKETRTPDADGETDENGEAQASGEAGGDQASPVPDDTATPDGASASGTSIEMQKTGLSQGMMLLIALLIVIIAVILLIVLRRGRKSSDS